MKKALILTFLVLQLTNPLFSQIGINNDNSNPDPSAMLDVKSTDKGVLVPRLTTSQREMISSPANGLLVFDSTTESFWFHSSGVWSELLDNSSWKKNGSDIYYNDGKAGIGISSPSDRLQVDADAAEPALRVRQDGATKLRIHSNGGTSIGANSTPPANGLIVIGEIEPQDNIITDQNLKIESTGAGTSVELKTSPNNLFLDNTGLYGFSQDVLIMETGTGSNKVEMNSLGLTTSSDEDVQISSALANSSISLGNTGVAASTSQNIVLETTSATGTLTIKFGTNEISIKEDGGIIISSAGNDLSINTNGGNLTLDSDNGDITLDSGNGDINLNGQNMDFMAAGTFDAASAGAMSIKSTGSTIGLESSAAMNIKSINSSLTAQSNSILKLNAGLTLDLDGTSNMTLNAPVISLNSGSVGAARLSDITVGNSASQTIVTASSTVLIGN